MEGVGRSYPRLWLRECLEFVTCRRLIPISLIITLFFSKDFMALVLEKKFKIKVVVIGMVGDWFLFISLDMSLIILRRVCVVKSIY